MCVATPFTLRDSFFRIASLDRLLQSPEPPPSHRETLTSFKTLELVFLLHTAPLDNVRQAAKRTETAALRPRA